MFSSNPLDKSCIGPDCSSGRNTASNRFPVGITTLGDESQQNRIQLAVQKYNSSASTPLNSRCTVISPYRHSFLNNSLKSKNYEGDAEGTSRGEKRNGNQYEGVGAFPTIHLRKSAVRYRPIRRLSDAKMSYPELPVNRFLSNLPEACPDLKSTRSVLDVLEDLSGKKIHSKDDCGSNKLKSKGLGGDYLLNQHALYKPLFVQKPKISSVLTRDNTTQTLSTPDTELPSPKNTNSFMRNDASDPRAELRRKLAKQNNEIFASLSSSILSNFSLKRKIDKVIPAGDDENLTDGGSASKTPKMDHPNNYNGNGIPKSLNRSKTYSRDSIKPSRKSQISEASSPTSPNKDRLTTIYLDMKNTSRKSQIFQNSSTLPEAKTAEDASQAPTNLSNGFTSASNGFDNKIPNSVVKETSGAEEKTDKSEPKNSFTEKTEVQKPENENQNNKPVFSFPVNPANNVAKPPTFQFGINTSEKPPDSGSVDMSKKPTADNNVEKKSEETTKLSKPTVTFGSPNEKANFGSFKFGTDSNSSLVNSPKTSETVTAPTPQFSFGTNSPSKTQFEIKSPQNPPTTKLMFAFGQNPSTELGRKPEEKTTAIQPVSFNFGGKSNTDLPGQTSESGGTNQTVSILSPSASTAAAPDIVQSNKPVFSFGQKAETPTTTTASTTQEQKFTFTFGQKAGGEQNKQEFGQKSTNLFSFGQKPLGQETQTVTTAVTSPSQPAVTQTTSMFGQNVQPTSTPQVKFGQMSSPQMTNSLGAKSEASGLGTMSTSVFSQSSTSFPIKTSLFGPTNGFGSPSTQTTAGLTTSTSNATTFAFGTSATSQPGSTFGVSSASQTAPTFGVSSASQTAPTFGVSSASQTAPTFGGATTSQSMTGFGGASTSQPTSAFGTSVSTSAFGVSVTASSSFPVSSTSQAGTSFGATSTTQSVFGVASSSQSSFGVSSTTQSNTTFATSAPQFGTSSTTQSTPAFGASTGFGVPTSSQSNNVFGAPAPTQSAVRFGAPMPQSSSSFGASTGFSSASSTQPNTTFGTSSATSSSGFGASQSFAQPFKPTTSLGQTPSIFGQTPAPSFSSSSTFNSNQNSVFGQKPSSEGDMFDQNKIQTQGFGTTSQSFGNQNKFAFGMSTSNATNFTTSPPNTTSPPVFSFGGSTTANTFAFGGGTAMSNNNPQAPFAFKSPTNEPFKFGASTSTTKEGPGFGGSSAGSFSFGGQMNNNNAMAEQKPSFSFGNAQVSSSAPFAFGTTPSPSVFSFGSSGSGSSGSSFNFATPSPGGGFGQTPSASPGAPFPVPGTFSIGSGSSQSRPRATSRTRRRP